MRNGCATSSPAAIRHLLADVRPAVVLAALPVATLAGKVEGQTHTPQDHEHSHEVDARRLEVHREGDNQAVDGRTNGPEAIDRGDLAGDHGHEPGHECDDQAHLERGPEGSEYYGTLAERRGRRI